MRENQVRQSAYLVTIDTGSVLQKSINQVRPVSLLHKIGIEASQGVEEGGDKGYSPE